MVESVKVYQIIAEMGTDTLCKEEATVCKKYKTMDRKVNRLQDRYPQTANKKGRKYRKIQHFESPWISNIDLRIRPGRSSGLEETDFYYQRRRLDFGRC